MALTPEDVVNKRFQQTKFREGYDQDEVDDFLDEIVVELRRLIAENEELRRELDEASKRQAEQPAAPQQAAPVAAEEPVQEQPREEQRPEQFERPEAQARQGQPNTLAGQPFPVVKDDPATPENEAESSNSLLVLARRLHDEHVAEGARRRDSIIAEGEQQAKKLIADAELNARNITNEGDARAKQLVADAEAREKETVGRLEEQKSRIEGRIEELRVFEREYRNKLRSYIEGQLNDLNRQSANVEPQGPAGNQH